MVSARAAGPVAPPWRTAVFVIIFLLAVIPFLVTPVLPMIDYYAHLARYYALSYIDSDAFLAQNFEARWAILPNIGLDVMGVGLMRLGPPLLIAKLIVLIIFATQYFGILYFNARLTGRTSLLTALLAVPLLYSFIFVWGFANFLFALGMVFWGAGWWLAARERLILAVPTACAVAVVIFLTHGVAFALYGLLLGGLEIGFFLTSRPRSLRTLLVNMAALAAQAVAPLLLFRASPTSKDPNGVSNADEAVRQLAQHGALQERLKELASYRLSSIIRVSEGPSLAFDIVWGAAVLAVIAFLMRQGRIRVSAVTWPALALALVLVAITPPTLFGVGYVADRMPLFLAFLVVGALAVRPRAERLDAICLGLVGVLVAVRIAAIGVSWQSYRDDFASFDQISRQIPAHSVVGYVNLANAERLDPNPRCEMFGPLMVPLSGQASPIFAYTSQQPIALIGRLKVANDTLAAFRKRHPHVKGNPLRFEDMVASRAFDYVLVCEPGRLGPPTAAAERVGEAGRFALFRVHKAAPAAPSS